MIEQATQNPKASVPWMALAGNSSAYIEDKFLPDVVLREPSKLVQKEASAILDHWYKRQTDKKVIFLFKALHTADGPVGCPEYCITIQKGKGKARREQTPVSDEQEDEQEAEEKEANEVHVDEEDKAEEEGLAIDRQGRDIGRKADPIENRPPARAGTPKVRRQADPSIAGPEMPRSQGQKRLRELQVEVVNTPVNRTGPDPADSRTKPITVKADEAEDYGDSDSSPAEELSDSGMTDDEEDFSMLGGPPPHVRMTEIPRAVGKLGPPSSAACRYDYLGKLTSEPCIKKLADVLRKVKVFIINTPYSFNSLKINY